MTRCQWNLNAARVTPLSDATDPALLAKHFAGADLVVEAVFESLELKWDIIRQVEALTLDRCVFATLEIIPHAGTAEEALATAFAVGTRQGKTCVVVKDVPGFYVNRCLGPILAEVSALVKEGVRLEELDGAMKDFGSACLRFGVSSFSPSFSDPRLLSQRVQCRSDPSRSWMRSEWT
jgi:enoyl-CoA hydratase/long-chain 3-hydroxyacyl-CoA dehydrogenase